MINPDEKVYIGTSSGGVETDWRTMQAIFHRAEEWYKTDPLSPYYVIQIDFAAIQAYSAGVDGDIVEPETCKHAFGLFGRFVALADKKTSHVFAFPAKNFLVMEDAMLNAPPRLAGEMMAIAGNGYGKILCGVIKPDWNKGNG